MISNPVKSLEWSARAARGFGVRAAIAGTILLTARLAAQTHGSLDPTFNPGTGLDGAVHALAIQSDGKIVMGGDFSLYNGTARTRLARANADGSLDTGFNPGTGAELPVMALALQPDGKIIVGGYFTRLNGTTRGHLARLNADGSLDPAFASGAGADAEVLSLSLLADGRVLIAGNFTSVNGTTRNRIARLNADGSLDATFNPGTGAERVIDSLAVQADGKIVIGGNFLTVAGASRGRVARLGADGALDATFNPGTGASGEVNKLLLLDDGRVVIGGDFTTVNGTARNRIARLNADGSHDASFNPGTGANVLVTVLALQPDGKIVLGGFFDSFNGTPRGHVARLTANGALDLTFDPGSGTDFPTSALAIQRDWRILLGGGFTTFNGTPRARLARLFAAPPAPVLTSPLTADAAAGASFFYTITATNEPTAFTVSGLPAGLVFNSTTGVISGTPTAAGKSNLTIGATGAGGSTSATLVLAVTAAGGNPGRLTNLAIRTAAGTGAQTLIVGFVIGGGATGTQPLLVRGIGPALTGFGVPGALADPKLELYSGNTKISENDNWGGGATIANAAASTGAFALAANSLDAALIATQVGGAYTAQITGVAGATGIALAELYDLSGATPAATTPRLTNVSARAQVGTGGEILIAGFTIGGGAPRSVLIRAVGPTLGVFGVGGVLADPKLQLFTGPTLLLENDNWGGAAHLSATATSVGAFPIANAASRDAVLLVTLAPGGYTAQVSGVGNTTGVALVEVYEVP